MPDRLGGCELRHLRSFPDSNGLLVINSQMEEPFSVKRVFTVLAPSGALRGQHAHRSCSQFLMAPTGEIVVAVNDGDISVEHRLGNSTLGLLIPPMVWTTQFFTSDHSSLLVLCDQEYDESDYIREWDEYLQVLSTAREAAN